MQNKLAIKLLVLIFLFMGGCMKQEVKRYGMVIGIEKSSIDEYKRLHANVWPEVLKLLKKHHIINYSIYLTELERDKFCLFSYFEYAGRDFAKDMKEISEQPAAKKWVAVCNPLQKPIEMRKEGEWWHEMEEVLYLP